MFTMMTMIRKRPEVSTAEFRRFMQFDYGPTYVGLPETRSYVQYYLSDTNADEPIDAIVEISFDSVESMHAALQADSYQRAHESRTRYMRDGSDGIHSTVVEQKLVLR